MEPLPVNFVIETILILYYHQKNHHLSTTVESVSQNKNPKESSNTESQEKTTEDLKDLPVEHQLWTGSDGFQIATHQVSGMTTEPKQTTVESKRSRKANLEHSLNALVMSIFKQQKSSLAEVASMKERVEWMAASKPPLKGKSNKNEPTLCE